ncbi:kinase-like domain-containing protein [Syncephalis pseudoplumigaleata]|uniref:Kinase-like domain-containing protein n=1 Tax=Syncephalis pseudoplumigaleata TaxID=1712513 RepID=A0A4P9Z646_9FUNG|nr:kinase-like domain-containing protein [Syncephalis pseudoplumigaleata]|eukprot:RKP27592.1 kinase-like domain-containing protein [Syncephalis pseudoplumigaleata]
MLLTSMLNLDIPAHLQRAFEQRALSVNAIKDGDSAFIGKTLHAGRGAVVKCIKIDRHIQAERYAFNAMRSREGRGKEHIVKLYDEFPVNEQHCFVLEDIGGCTLDKYAKDKSSETKASPLRIIFHKLIRGVIYLHSIGVAHGDIKPQNIIVKEVGALFWRDVDVRIIDFDHAKPANTPSTSYGTLPYRPPESFQFEPTDPKPYDTWTIGATLYEAMSGRLPFSKLLNERKDPESFTLRMRQLSPRKAHADLFPVCEEYHDNMRYGALTDVVEELMAFSPKERPSLADVLGRL